jgi:hypothetical protein
MPSYERVSGADKGIGDYMVRVGGADKNINHVFQLVGGAEKTIWKRGGGVFNELKDFRQLMTVRGVSQTIWNGRADFRSLMQPARYKLYLINSALHYHFSGRKYGQSGVSTENGFIDTSDRGSQGEMNGEVENWKVYINNEFVSNPLIYYNTASIWRFGVHVYVRLPVYENPTTHRLSAGGFYVSILTNGSPVRQFWLETSGDPFRALLATYETVTNGHVVIEGEIYVDWFWD